MTKRGADKQPGLTTPEGEYSTPDVTKAQAGAVATFVGGPIAAHAAGIEGDQLFAVIVGSAIVSIAWVIADAVIRGNRAKGGSNE